MWCVVLNSFATTITVTSNSDSGSGSLRAAISAASSGDVINFHNSLANDSIVLTSGFINIGNKHLSIQGLGADKLSISGRYSQSIFVVSSGFNLQLEDLTIRDGKSTGSNQGGAIRNAGTLTVNRCYFANNHALAEGGAIFNTGTVFINESTFSYNSADSAGGAIFNSGGLIKIQNSTISYNSASIGGGINNKSISSVVPIAEIISSTIVFNYASDKGGGFANTFLNYQDTVITVFSSSIIALNNCSKFYGNDIYRGLSSRCYMNSNGYNLIGNSDSSGLQGSTGDIVGNSTSRINPLIGNLGYYGGSTMTHKLLCGSPALDNGDPFSSLSTDQRLLSRNFNGIADIGSFESQEDLYIPFFNLGPDVDTCMGVVILYIAGRASDSVNWLKTDQTLLLANSKSYTHITGVKDSIVGEVISLAGCAGYDTVIVSFHDNTKPVISNCPTSITTYSGLSACEAIVNWAEPFATDNCHIDTFYSDFHSGDTFSIGTNVVTYTAIDDAAESTSCSFNVIVKDSINPVISCLSDITTVNKSNLCGDTITFIPPIGTDNCLGATIKLVKGLSPGSLFPVGTTEEVYVVSDVSGNTDSCRFNITVNDIEIPQIDCRADTIITADSGLCEAVFEYDLPLVEDNCNNLTLTLTAGLPTGNPFPIGETIVRYEVADPSGNKSSCSFKVTVKDDEKPIIQCPAKIESCDSIVDFNLPVYSDNCSSSTLTQLSGFSTGSIFPVGSTYNIFQATDLAGNSAVCSLEIVVHPKPKIALSADTTIYYGDGIYLYVHTNDSLDFDWTPISFLDDPYSHAPFASPSASTTFIVNATSKNGCIAADSIFIQVLFEVLIPTAFTPGNSDGMLKNENWELKGIRMYPTCEVSIFNSWGDKIFSSVGYTKAWNGTLNDRDLPTGSYFYIVDLNDGQKPLSGTVTIIR